MRICPQMTLVVVAVQAACLGPPLLLPSAKDNATFATPKAAAGKGGARAFVIERALDLPDGALADAKLGDIRIENNRAVFIIDAVSALLGYAESGGNLIDAFALTPTGHTQDGLKQVFGFLNNTYPRQPSYGKVSVVGTGEQAIVRAEGLDSQNPNLQLVTDYMLAPDSPALEIVTRITNIGNEPVNDYAIGDAIEWGRIEPLLIDSDQEKKGAVRTPHGFVLGLAESTTYAYVTGKGDLDGYADLGWSDFVIKKVTLRQGESASVRRFFLAAETSDPTLATTIARILRQSWARIEGKVVEELTGKTIAGARLLFEDDEGRVIFAAVSKADGYRALVPPGDYRLRVELSGRRGPLQLQVTMRPGSPVQRDILVSRAGRLHLRVLGGDGNELAAKVTIVGLEDTPAPRLGPPFARRAENIALVPREVTTFDLQPGHYRLFVSHGPFYTIETRDIVVTPGAESDETFHLAPAVDLAGYACLDLHQHTLASADSAVSREDRLLSDEAEGLQGFVAGDYNMIDDYRGIIDRHDDDALFVMSGEEAGAEGLGHFSAYPLEPHHELRNNGALDVRGRNVSDLVNALRGLDHFSDKVIEVNHPRDGTVGYFNQVKLDPQSPTLPPTWEGGFDAIEVLTGKSTAQFDAVMRDWFSLLNRGLRYTAVGGSDARSIARSEVGYPRTCVALAAADKTLSNAAVVRALRIDRNAFVTNGPVVRVSAQGKKMGQLADAPKGRARLDIDVQAAPWLALKRIELFVNGARRGRPIAIEPSQARERFHQTVELKLTEDSYVVVVVRGDESLEPILLPGAGESAPTAIAVTNPIFFDRDGDGKFSSPHGK
jgi:hypothetical protein